MFVLVVFALWMTLAIASALVVSALGRAASSGDELSAISEPTPLAEVAPVAGHRSGEFARAADGLRPVTRPSRAIAGGRLR